MSEFDEFKEATLEQDREHMEEEFGDILFATVNLARWNKIDAEQALLRANKKFTKRFKKMEEIAEKPFEDYSYEEALLAVKEMVELLTLELTEKHLVTNVVYLYVGYSKDIIKPTGGRIKLDGYTSLYSKIKEAFINLYIKTTNKKYLIRKLNIGFGNVENEEYETYDLLIDQEELSKEKRIQETIVEIKRRYGKNAILKGMNLEEKATTRKRNKLIGGHNGE